MSVVVVLLATYQGATYLPDFLASLERQTAPWRLLARDDGSTDATPRQLQAFAQRHPDRVRLLPGSPEGRPGGARANFAALLEAARAEGASVVALADQDDVWVPTRLATGWAALRQAEAALPPGTPVLVHTDLAVVDAALRPQHPSFWRARRLDPWRRSDLRSLLLENVVTGCASTFNGALLDRALPIPSEAIMHDWWLALVAAAFGRIVPVAQPTVLYRQHGGNTIGADAWSLAFVLRQAVRPAAIRARIDAGWRQATAFAARYRSHLAPADAAFLQELLALRRRPWFARRRAALRLGLRKGAWARTLGFYAFL